uniref:C2H2-type domain-containing protein n=1 Tax=Glossina austeni TaxID=7395 RepID=A0A1A9VXT1_GLOAU
MLKSPSNAQELRLPRPEHTRTQSPATMDALKTSFLPNLSMDPAIVATAHFCPMCGQQFEGPQQATEHMHLCHGGLSVVTGVGGGSILLAPHHVSANPSDPIKIDYPCHSCDDKFSTEQELDEHHRLIHQAPAFLTRCPACNFFGISATALQETSEFKCVHCGSVCTAANLSASQPAYENHASDNMPAMTSQGMKLSSHDLTQRQYQQQQVPLSQPQAPQQQQQTRDNRLNDVELKVPPLTVKLNKNVNSNSVMHPHVIIKQEPINGDGNDASPTSVPVYTIQQTPSITTSVVVSTTQATAATTINNTTPNTATNASKVRHKCPDCPKTFKTPSTLAMHRKVHTGEAEITPKERPYICSYCGKSFTQSNTLKQHTRIHTGEKPFRCGYCGRAFTVKDYLNKHLTTHTGEKPFQCTYCEKAFSVKDYLTKHIRTHTGEKPYTCPYCEKRFTQRSALTVHTTKLHPL